MKMKILIFILSPTADGNCEVLTRKKSNGYYLIPSTEVLENPQLEALRNAQDILNLENVELLSYFGSKEHTHAYVLRTIGAEIQTEQITKMGYQFTGLNVILGTKVQSEAKAFWNQLLDYVQEHMVWD